jgi:hypothetical protein
MSLETITLMGDLPTHTPTQNRVRVRVGVRDKVRRGWDQTIADSVHLKIRNNYSHHNSNSQFLTLSKRFAQDLLGRNPDLLDTRCRHTIYLCANSKLKPKGRTATHLVGFKIDLLPLPLAHLSLVGTHNLLYIT